MARRRRTKQLALAVLPAAATTLAVATGMGPAGANTTTASHTYTDLNGIQHTCTVNLTRTVPFNNDSQVGQGATSVTSNANCSGVISYISATWNDPDGEFTSTIENSDGQSTTRRYAPIGSDFVTQHHVDFTGVPAGCQSNCEFFATRTK